MMTLSLEHAILGLLDEQPLTGYELKTRCFDDELKPFWEADQAQIYRTLHRLQDQGLVSSRRRRQSGRPDRRVFTTTHRGREVLADWMGSSQPAQIPRDPLLLQLYFGADTEDERLVEVLRARRRVHQTRLEDLRRRLGALAADHALPDRASTLRQTAFHGAIARERAIIDWLDDCVDAIDQGALPGSQDRGIGQRHLFGT